MSVAVEIDREEREVAEGWVADLAQKIGDVESSLALLASFIEDHAAGAAAIGSLGIKAGEMREQLPAIRQAIRDLDPDYSQSDVRATLLDGRGVLIDLKTAADRRGQKGAATA